MQRNQVEQIRVAINVLNLTSGYGMVWCASIHPTSELGRELYGLEAEVRFFQVPDDSHLLQEEGIIKA